MDNKIMFEGNNEMFEIIIKEYNLIEGKDYRMEMFDGKINYYCDEDNLKKAAIEKYTHEDKEFNYAAGFFQDRFLRYRKNKKTGDVFFPMEDVAKALGFNDMHEMVQRMRMLPMIF